jgi:phosphoglycerate dehydrogenase-like enzyme
MFHWDGPHLPKLRAAGFEIAYPPQKRALLSEDELIGLLPGISAVIAGSEPFTPRVFASAPELRVISRAGVGSDAVVLDAATRHRVVVTIAAGTNHHAVAEHALSMLFALVRRLPQLDRQVRDGVWAREPLPPIRGRTLGIVGLGRIGRAVATRARAFDLRVLGYDPLPNTAAVHAAGIELVDLPTLLGESDFVTLHVPLGPDTRDLIDGRAIAQMKKGAILINTARGGVIAERDLILALRSGHVAAAGLDVFEVEPAVPNPFREFPNVLLSPHLAGADSQSMLETCEVTSQNIIDLQQGRWPDGCVVNTDVCPGWRW